MGCICFGAFVLLVESAAVKFSPVFDRVRRRRRQCWEFQGIKKSTRQRCLKTSQLILHPPPVRPPSECSSQSKPLLLNQAKSYMTCILAGQIWMACDMIGLWCKRYLNVRWGTNLSNVVVSIGENGDTDYKGLLGGLHKNVILKGVCKNPPPKLYSNRSYPLEHVLPFDSPNIVHCEGLTKEGIKGSLRRTCVLKV